MSASSGRVRARLGLVVVHMGRGDSKAEIALDGRLTRLGTAYRGEEGRTYTARSVGTYPTTQRHEMMSAGGPAGSPRRPCGAGPSPAPWSSTPA